MMGFVLADKQGWLQTATTTSSTPSPFEVVPLQTFEKLREGMNNNTADFFMWEHFTSKKYYDNGEIKRIGEIYTPWSSWKIVASTKLVGAAGRSVDNRLQELFAKIDKGVQYFEGHRDEAVTYISTALDYSEEDAREWMKTVRFCRKVEGVDVVVIQKTVEILQKAGVLGENGMQAQEMIGIELNAQLPPN